MKKILGTVVSDKMAKRAVVSVERQYRHPLYGKILRLKKKYHVVNELGAKAGDKVTIAETRPISKTISFKIIEIENGQKSKISKVPNSEIKK